MVALHDTRSRWPFTPRKKIAPFLALTILLGLAFLVVKGFEFHKDLHDRLLPGVNFDPSLPPPAQMFFWLLIQCTLVASDYLTRQWH